MPRAEPSGYTNCGLRQVYTADAQVLTKHIIRPSGGCQAPIDSALLISQFIHVSESTCPEAGRQSIARMYRPYIRAHHWSVEHRAGSRLKRDQDYVEERFSVNLSSATLFVDVTKKGAHQ